MEDTPEATRGNAPLFFLKQPPGGSHTAAAYGLSLLRAAVGTAVAPAACFPTSCARVRAGFPRPLLSHCHRSLRQVSASFQSRPARTHTQRPPCHLTPRQCQDSRGSARQDPVPEDHVGQMDTPHSSTRPGSPSTRGREPGGAHFLRPHRPGTRSACPPDASFLLGCYLEQFPRASGSSSLGHRGPREPAGRGSEVRHLVGAAGGRPLPHTKRPAKLTFSCGFGFLELRYHFLPRLSGSLVFLGQVCRTDRVEGVAIKNRNQQRGPFPGSVPFGAGRAERLSVERLRRRGSHTGRVSRGRRRSPPVGPEVRPARLSALRVCIKAAAHGRGFPRVRARGVRLGARSRFPHRVRGPMRQRARGPGEPRAPPGGTGGADDTTHRRARPPRGG